MAYRLFLFGISLLIFSPVRPVRAADIMFEGYYRIDFGGKQVGYNIQRYQYDPKTKVFESFSFLKAKLGDDVVQESLKARADSKLMPISYQYTSQAADQIKTIDATFKGNIMTLAITDGGKSGKVRNEKHKLPANTILSTFLVYKLLRSELKVSDVFTYSAVAEEDGASYNGKIWLQARTERGPYSVFRVLNRFKAQEFYSSLALVPDGNPKGKNRYERGEVFSSRSPEKNISVELVPKASEATEGQMVPNKVLLTLFASMPSGKVNLLASPPTAKVASPAQPPEKNEK